MFYCNRVVVSAPGKINLALGITGQRQDGYHLMDMVMLSVDLCDVVVVGKRSDEEIRVTCSNPLVPEDETNLAHRAAVEFFKAAGLPEQGLSIHIDKLIPIQAGLAGGSADAAAVLCGLNRLLETNFPISQLREIGLTLGADVPFCLEGGCARAQGVGELLTPLPLPDHALFAIAKPPYGVSTRCAFQLYDRQDKAGTPEPELSPLIDALVAGDLAAAGQGMFNVLERSVCLEEVETLKGILLCNGALGAVMSGSGSAVVGLFDSEKAARHCLRFLREQVKEVFLAKPSQSGARVVHIG